MLSDTSRPVLHHTTSAVSTFPPAMCGCLLKIYPDGSSSLPSLLKPLKTQAMSSRKQQSNLAGLPLPDCNLTLPPHPPPLQRCLHGISMSPGLTSHTHRLVKDTLACAVAMPVLSPGLPEADTLKWQRVSVAL